MHAQTHLHLAIMAKEIREISWISYFKKKQLIK